MAVQEYCAPGCIFAKWLTGVPALHIKYYKLIQQRKRSRKRLRLKECIGWELFIPWLASYRRSMFFRWLILARVHNSRLSTLFPAMASLSTALSLSSTAGMCVKQLKESPRLLSCDRPPSSSGSEIRWFPSKDRVCRLQDREEKTNMFYLNFRVVKISASVHL